MIAIGDPVVTNVRKHSVLSSAERSGWMLIEECLARCSAVHCDFVELSLDTYYHSNP
jgi:ferredoxin